MRTIRHTATALFTSLLLLTSCGPDGPTGTGVEEPPGPKVAGEAPAEAEELSLERVDQLLAAGELRRAVDWIAAERDELALEAPLAGRMVRALWALDEVPRAVRVARATLEREPDAMDVVDPLAAIYMSLDQQNMAVDVLRAARAAGAPDAKVAITLGVCLGRMEDLEGAREEFERAAAAGASREDVDYNMAVLLIGEGQHEEAEALLQAVADAHPANADARRELARMLLHHRPEEDGRREAALEHLNAVLDQRADDWRAFELMGDYSMATDDPVAAVTYYTEALRYGKNPPHVEDKYRDAALARNELLAEQGLIEPDVEEAGERKGPPIPMGVQQRWKEAREKQRQAAQDEAAADGSEPQQGQ